MTSTLTWSDIASSFGRLGTLRPRLFRFEPGGVADLTPLLHLVGKVLAERIGPDEIDNGAGLGELLANRGTRQHFPDRGIGLVDDRLRRAGGIDPAVPADDRVTGHPRFGD